MNKKMTILSLVATAIVAAGAITAFAASPKQQTVMQQKCYIVGYWEQPQQLYVDDYWRAGLHFDEEGKLYYWNEPVRYFVDGATTQPHAGSYTLDEIRYKEEPCVYLYEYYDEQGTIDLYSVRQEDPTAPEGSEGLGGLLRVEAFNPGEFDERSFIYATEVDWDTKTDDNNYILV